MSVAQATLARRLKEARESSQVTEEQAAQTLGLQLSDIAQVEAGSRSVSTLELAMFAKVYHRTIASFFPEGETANQVEARIAPFDMLDETVSLDNESARQIAFEAIEAYRREELSRGRLLEISAKLGYSAFDRKWR